MRALPASATLVAALLLAAGCTDSSDSPGAPEAGDPPATQTSSPVGPTPTPTSTPTASEPSAPLSLVDRLLPTGQVPGLNAAWHWQDGVTGPAGSEPFGLCAQTSPGADLASIGATEVVERTWFPPDDSDDNAAEQIAEFPDTATTGRAWAVLKSWHDRCGKTLSADTNLDVRPFVPVPVTTGTGRWYLLSQEIPGEETGRFEAFGMVRTDTRIAVLRITNSGQDYDYPAGEEPMVGMVQAAAGRLD
jgi:hypothetical protein